MFGIKTSKSFIATISITAALTATAAQANNGVLLTPSMCQDANGFRDAYWAQNNNVSTKYPNIYYMRNGGSIVQVKGSDGIDTITTLMITAHGNCSAVGGWTNYQFAKLLKANLPKPDILKTITTVSCHGADTLGPTANTKSLLTELQTTMTDTKLFTGFAGVASLSGDSNGILDSKFTGNSYVDSDATLAALQYAKEKSDEKWAQHDVKIGQITLPLKEFCDKVEDNDSFFSDTLLGDTIGSLYDETVKEFTNTTQLWSDTTKLLKHGNKPEACGSDHNKDTTNTSKNKEECSDL